MYRSSQKVLCHTTLWDTWPEVFDFCWDVQVIEICDIAVSPFIFIWLFPLSDVSILLMWMGNVMWKVNAQQIKVEKDCELVHCSWIYLYHLIWDVKRFRSFSPAILILYNYLSRPSILTGWKLYFVLRFSRNPKL